MPQSLHTEIWTYPHSSDPSKIVYLYSANGADSHLSSSYKYESNIAWILKFEKSEFKLWSYLDNYQTKWPSSVL